MKTLALAFGIGLGVLVLANPVSAQYGCPNAYGGEVCPTGDVTIDKKVQNPQSFVFVDNLGSSDARFGVGQEVTFRLTVKNVSDVLIDKVDVFDFLPVELEYVSGPGTYDVNTREVRFSVEQLSPNASRDFEVKAKVAQNLPDRSLITVVNKAEVRLVGETDKDSSQLVIEKPFAGGLPATGPAVEVMLTVSGLLGTAGIVLMKRASIS